MRAFTMADLGQLHSVYPTLLSFRPAVGVVLRGEESLASSSKGIPFDIIWWNRELSCLQVSPRRHSQVLASAA